MGLFDDVLPQEDAAPAGGLFSDVLDSTPPKSSAVRRGIADPAISLLKGAIAIPEAAVGLADIPTLGLAGKAAEGIGFRPKEAKAELDTWYSPEQQAANQRVQEAKGFVPTLQAAVQNPSVIGHTVAESVPAMLGGAAVARGLLGAGAGALSRVVGSTAAPIIAGAAGEGIVGAGLSAEQIRQETPEGTLSPAQAGSALASGVGTGLIGAAGGAVARKLGLSDVDTMLAGGAGIAGTRKLPARVLGGAVSEGVLEEMPQSAQEQAWQNVALGKPVMEGIPEQAALGGLAGAAMGGVGGIVPSRSPAPGPLQKALDAAAGANTGANTGINTGIDTGAPVSDELEPPLTGIRADASVRNLVRVASADDEATTTSAIARKTAAELPQLRDSEQPNTPAAPDPVSAPVSTAATSPQTSQAESAGAPIPQPQEGAVPRGNETEVPQQAEPGQQAQSAAAADAAAAEREWQDFVASEGRDLGPRRLAIVREQFMARRKMDSGIEEATGRVEAGRQQQAAANRMAVLDELPLTTTGNTIRRFSSALRDAGISDSRVSVDERQLIARRIAARDTLQPLEKEPQNELNFPERSTRQAQPTMARIDALRKKAALPGVRIVGTRMLDRYGKRLATLTADEAAELSAARSAPVVTNETATGEPQAPLSLADAPQATDAEWESLVANESRDLGKRRLTLLSLQAISRQKQISAADKAEIDALIAAEQVDLDARRGMLRELQAIRRQKTDDAEKAATTGKRAQLVGIADRLAAAREAAISNARDAEAKRGQGVDELSARLKDAVGKTADERRARLEAMADRLEKEKPPSETVDESRKKGFKGVPIDKPGGELTDDEVARILSPAPEQMKDRNYDLAMYESDPRFLVPAEGHTGALTIDYLAVRDFLRDGSLSERGQLIDNMAGWLRAQSPEFTRGGSIKTAGSILSAIEDGRYNSLLHPDNKHSRALFASMTGNKLPAGVSATMRQFTGTPIAVVNPPGKAVPAKDHGKDYGDVRFLHYKGANGQWYAKAIVDYEYVKLPGLGRYKFFLHDSEGLRAVSEERTGRALATATTDDGAISAAKETISRVGVSRVSAVIDDTPSITGKEKDDAIAKAGIVVTPAAASEAEQESIAPQATAPNKEAKATPEQDIGDIFDKAMDDVFGPKPDSQTPIPRNVQEMVDKERAQAALVDKARRDGADAFARGELNRIPDELGRSGSVAEKQAYSDGWRNAREKARASGGVPKEAPRAAATNQAPSRLPQPRSAPAAATSAAKNAGMGLADVANGLNALFKPKPGTLGMGLPFDEDTYAAAKPYFQAGIAHFKQAGADLTEMVKSLIVTLRDQFGMDRETIANMKPYVVRFMDDVKSGKLDYDESSTQKDASNDSPDAAHEIAIDQSMAERQPAGLRYTPARGAAASRYRPGRADDRGVRGAGRIADSEAVESESLGNGEGTPGVHDGQDDALAGGVRRVSADFRPGLGALTREGSWFDAAKRNIDLIGLAIQIDKEKRNATPEEQALLAKYVGFGASEIRNALFPIPGQYAKSQEPNRLIWPNLVRDARWKPLAERIDALPREWQQSILQSTQYAHYTSEGVIRSIWSAVQRLGFTGGNIFEPGTGIGSFSMLMPDSVHASSHFTGVEFDGPTALIARLLSPDQQIQHDDFIKRKFPKDYFDVIVGNPPFSATKILGDPEYAKSGFMLHDFFFAKSIDLVRPGGLQVFVTSKGTMDKRTDRARKFLSDRADLVGAIRLPSTAFEGNAGTSVVTDVIFLKKRAPGEAPGGMAWGSLKTVETKDGPVDVNEYFADHPEMILGQQRISGNVDDLGRRVSSNGYGGEKYTVVSYDSTPAELDAKFAQAVEKLPGNIYSPIGQSSESVKAETRKVDFDPTVKREGVVYLAKDGTVLRVTAGVGVPLDESVKLSENDRSWYKGYVGLRDLVQSARLAQANDGNWKAALKALNKAYDTFRATHGPIRDFRTQVRKSTDEEGNPVETESRIFKNKRLYREDYDASLLTALERITESGEIVKAPFLLDRTIGKPAQVEIKSVGDALAVSLDSTGFLDLDDVARRMRVSREEAIDALGNQIYKTPAGKWQLSDEYLSGDVVTKLEEAEHLAHSRPEYRRNVEALKTVQPEKLGPSQISAKLGASWLPAAHVNEFAKEIGAGHVTFDIKTETWQVEGGNKRNERKAGAEYGTAARSASELLEAALNSRSIKVTAVVDKKTVTDVAATTAANEAAKKIKDTFKRWVWTDSERAADLVEAYNKRFNNIAPRKFDGSHLSLPGVSLRFKLHPHQLRSIWRQIQTGNTYLAHAVGAGKAQPLDAKVLTPSGWKLMGDVRVGDTVIAGDGTHTTVTGTYPQGLKEIFRVQFSDGSTTECCDEHLWLTQTYKERSAGQRALAMGKQWPSGEAKVRALFDIRQSLVAPHLGAKNHSIPMVGPVDFAAQPVRLDGYLMGVLLGDGGMAADHVRISSGDDEVIDLCTPLLPVNAEFRRLPKDGKCPQWQIRRAEKRGYGKDMEPNPVVDALRDYGLQGCRSVDKFVPDAYKLNTADVRLSTLQGLLDTDGTVDRRGHSVYFYSVSDRLADDVTFLAQSLGGTVSRSRKTPTFMHKGEKRTGQDCHVLCLKLPQEVQPFRLARKVALHKPKTSYAPTRYIVAVEPVGRKEAQCIMVDHPDHLYVTDDFIVTHNTIEMIAGAMEQKRLGLIRKPMFVVPNHMLEQFSNEFMELYPLANIMVADDENFSAERRKAFIASATLNNPDAIIITHSAFKRIGVTEESVAPIRDEIISDLEIELSSLANDQGTRVRRSQLQQQIEAVAQRFDAIVNASGKDSTIKFEDIGTDFIYADEAHAFRKLDFHTAQSIKGIDPNGSQAAMDIYVKTRILERSRPGRSFVFASGTPVTNTMGELFTIMRFFSPEEMDRAGISTFDSWARQFGEVAPALEPNAAGKYELIERFSKFDNVPELMSRIRQFMDVLTSEHLGSLVKRPDLAGGKPNLNIVDSNAELESYMRTVLAPRIEASKQWKPSPQEPNNPDPIVAIITDGRFAAIDPRFFGGKLEGDSIITTMAGKVVDKYHATKGNVYHNKDGKPETIKGSTQIVFYNLGFGAQSQLSRGFNSRAAFTKLLTDGGIPRAEIAWFDDANTDAKKEAVFKDMRSGKLKVLIGSAKKMGTGVNVQNRLIALHYQDPPWFPADVEQPHGRIIRQGNLNPEVSIDWYTTKGTYQSTMWQMVGRKQRFIDQAFSGDKSLRSMDDLGEASLFEQAAAVASGDPRALQLAGLRQDVERFERLQAAHASEQINIRSALREAEWGVSSAAQRVSRYSKAFKAIGERYFAFESGKVDGRTYAKTGEFGQALKDAFNQAARTRLADMVDGEQIEIARIGDSISVVMEAQIDKNKPTGMFSMSVSFGGIEIDVTTSSPLGSDVDAVGLARRVFNRINEVEGDLRRARNDLVTNETDITRLRKKLGAPFEYQQEMVEKYGELKRLEAELQAESDAPASTDGATELATPVPKASDRQRIERMAPVDDRLYNADTDTIAGSTADRAIYDMAQESRPSADILSFIGKASRRPFNRYLANALRNLGVAPAVTLDAQGGWKFNQGKPGAKYAAAYNPKTDTVALFTPRDAERHLLHEMVHAATLKAIARSGVSAMRMRKLFLHVQRSGRLDGQYGMSNLDEFVAEAFSNPKLQAALKDIPAPKSSTLRNAWEWFVRLVANALGFKTAPMRTALDEAMTVGAALMRENAALTGEVGGVMGSAALPDTITINGVERPTTNSNGKPIAQDEESIRRFWEWFGDSRVVDEQGRPLVVYHGTSNDFARFNLKKLGENTIGEASSEEIGQTSRIGHWFSSHPMGRSPDNYGAGYSIDMPVYLKITNQFSVEENDDLAVMLEGGKKGATLRKELASEGYDGVRIKRDTEFEGSSFIAFAGSQAKSATGNSGQFSPNNPDIRYSAATDWYNGQSGAPVRNVWQAAKAKAAEILLPKNLDKIIYELQDKYVDLRRLRDHIRAIGGTITDLNDAYLGEELYHKRLAHRTQDFLKAELRPLLGEMKARGVTMQDLESFLHARHAPEANAEMAKRNPNRAEIDAGQAKAATLVRNLEQRLQNAKARGLATVSLEQALNDARGELLKWNGAQAFRGTEEERRSLSGLSDAAAAAIMNGLTLERRADLDALAARVDAINEGTLQHLQDYGLMSRESLDAWRKTYRYYIPLHRDEAHPDSANHPIGQGFSVKGDAAKRRTGSNQQVTHILGHIAMQREAALTRGEKNHVMLKLYLMARQNPLPDVWKVGSVPTIDTIDKATGFVKSIPDPLYKTRPNVLVLRVGGKDVAITINEHNPEALRMAHALKNLDVDDLHYLIPVVGKMTRWFASMNTQYNPIFGVINLIRDAQSAALNLNTTELAGKQGQVLKDTLSILKGAMKNGGRMPTAGAWATLFEEFNRVGGTTGYRDLFLNAEDRAKALLSELQALDRGKASQAAHAVASWLSDYNEAMENSVRLAAYKAALDNGMSRERAASLAKNLTVNFNRKGRQTRELGALYAFFNASVQGTTRMAQTLAGPAGRKIMVGGVLLGALNAMMGLAMMGGGDDDDDEWEKIPEFVKERSIIIPTGKDAYLSIPMPLGFHFLPNIGRLAVEMAVYKDKTLGKQMASLFTVLADAFNPLGGSSPALQIAAPTVLDPFVALAQNKDWTGKPIYIENRNSLDPQPGTQRSKDSATPWAKGFAEAINAVTGGTDYTPGGWSPTPDQVDYVIGQLTGGLGREAGKVAATAAAPFTGEELPPYKIPLVGRLYGSTAGHSGQSTKFYENVTKANEAENEIKGRARQGIAVADYLTEHPGAIELAARGNVAERQVAALRKARHEAVTKGGPDEVAKVRDINERMAGVMRNFNREADAIGRKSAQ